MSLPILERNLTKYLKISEIIQKHINGGKFKKHQISKDEELKIKIINCDSNIDYDQFADTFAEMYWIRNYWKAVYFFEYGPESLFLGELKICRSPKILVLGAGSATDTIAYMVWANDHLVANDKTEIILVDRSRRQLSLARNLINETKKHLKNINFDIKYLNVDVHNWSPEQNSADLVLMSHFLTENVWNLSVLLNKVKSAVKSRGRVVTIERERDIVWEKAKNIFTEIGIPIVDMPINKSDLKFFKNNVGGQQKDISNMTPHYVLARLPESKEQIEIVSKYFEAWRKKSVNLVEEIFSKKATYHEKPLTDKPIYGIDAIKKYWELNPVLQKNINVFPKKVSYELGSIACEFVGDFDTPKQHIDIQGVLMFDIESRRGKISAIREYFNTIKKPFLNST